MELKGDGADIRYVSRDQMAAVLAKMPKTVKIDYADGYG
jgi:hypothetical protein